ncbi:chloramphenicol phosphotransferase CPT family protein [Phenylobacterium sp.]|uniref:chloramphenicol phosphotransferase CPT family protein n=1 Tax=Phenylobacterium sp. TaxID=1871053 RepID=UPI003D26C4F3
MTGKAILLNGASSRGKSSIARAVQARIGEPFWHFSIDHLRDAGVLPLDRIRSGEFPWSDQRDAFFDGFRQSLKAFLAPGNNLIVEHIVETPAWMQQLTILLESADVFFVGVHCPLADLERRELARGDRPIGSAACDFHNIHRHAVYDLELDGTHSPETNAHRLIGEWAARERPSAFDRLRLG